MARLRYGNALGEAGRLDEAIEQFDAAVALTPGNPQLHFSRGVARSMQGRPDDARACFEHALELDPDYEPARLGLEELDRRRSR